MRGISYGVHGAQAVSPDGVGMNAPQNTTVHSPSRTGRLEESCTTLSSQPATPLPLRVSIGAAAALVVFLGALVGLGGCATSDEVGHTKTVEKRVIDTPTEKVTVTETHEKDTKIVR